MDQKNIQGATSGSLQAHYQTAGGANKAHGTKGKETESDYPRTGNELLQVVDRLTDFTIEGDLNLELHGRSFHSNPGQHWRNVAERFLGAKSSSFVFMEAPDYHPTMRFPLVTLTANEIIQSAAGAGLPAISFFCDALPSSHDPHLRDPQPTPKPPILGLVYSLIVQMADMYPSEKGLGPIMTFSQLASLDTNPGSWRLALQL